MIDNGVFIKYGDIAVGAKEQFVPTATDKSFFVNFSQLKENVSFPNYTNPTELYSTSLDGNSFPIPDSPESANMGWWSEHLSNENGEFAEPIVLNISSKDSFSSIGITFIFDENNNVYANNLRIRWYRGNELISEKNFNPDNYAYLCKNKVEFYNKLEVTFFSINMPQNRLKLHSIEYGYGAEFTGKELRSVKITQEIDAVSSQIPINTCDFDLSSQKDIEFSFQERQPIDVYYNGKLRSKTFIKDFVRKSKTQWSVKTEDYIGIMDSVPFAGGIYQDELAIDVLNKIFSTAKVPFSVEESFAESRITGYIPYTTCRQALMQVAFAIGAIVDTSNREDVYIYRISDKLTQTIPLNRIMQGQNFTNEARVTSVEVFSHKYNPVEDSVVLYNSEKDGVGENIFVKFSQPIHSLSITEGSYILESGANYAIINAYANCVLTGKKYEHVETIKSKKNPLVIYTDTENIISIQNATLVSNENVDKILEKCYNYFVNTRKVNLKIVEGKRRIEDVIKYGQKKYGSFKYGDKNATFELDKVVNIGDYVAVETEYLGEIRGTTIRQSYNLNGGIIIKDTIVR